MQISPQLVEESSALDDLLRELVEYEGDWLLMREAVGAARAYRESLSSLHQVRPAVPAGLAEAFALHVAGWGKPAREVLQRLLGLEEKECLYVLGGSIVESAWRYWLIQTGVVQVRESAVWKTIVSLRLGRLADASDVELILYPLCRRLLLSLEGFWDYYYGEGAIRVQAPLQDRSEQFGKGRQPGRDSRRLRAFCQECVRRQAEVRGWGHVPVVLVG